MTITIERRTFHYLKDSQFPDLTLQYEPICQGGLEPISPLVQRIQYGEILVSYLSIDEEPCHPFEGWDDVGQVDDLIRDDNPSETLDTFRRSLGLFGDTQLLSESARFAVLLDDYRVHNSETLLKVRDDSGDANKFPIESSPAAGVWLPSESCRRSIEREAWIQALPEGVKIAFRARGDSGNIVTYELPNGSTFGGFRTVETAAQAAAKAMGVPSVPT